MSDEAWRRIIGEFLVDVAVTPNIVVVKTGAGHASTVSQALDETGWPGSDRNHRRREHRIHCGAFGERGKETGASDTRVTIATSGQVSSNWRTVFPLEGSTNPGASSASGVERIAVRKTQDAVSKDRACG